MAGKRCGRCDTEKSLDEFYTHQSGRRAGRPVSICKACGSAYQKAKYARRKSGELSTVIVAEQRCNDCFETKPPAEFGVDHARPNGLRVYCRFCSNIRTRMSKYGMTRDEIIALPSACEVCASTARLVIDHDHTTGVVRGVLCDDCNVALGRLRDDADRIMGLAFYLVRSENVIGAVL